MQPNCLEFSLTLYSSSAITLFHFQCLISLGYVDSDYIMCGHRDVETNTVCPGPRFGSNWVNSHARYGRRDEDGGVSVQLCTVTGGPPSTHMQKVYLSLYRNAHLGMSKVHWIALIGSIQQNQVAIAPQEAPALFHSQTHYATP